MTKINEFLYASEALEHHRKTQSMLFSISSHASQDPQLQQELQKARTMKMLQDIPGIG